MIISNEDIKALRRKDFYEIAQRKGDGKYSVFYRRLEKMPDNSKFQWTYWEAIAVEENEQTARNSMFKHMDSTKKAKQ